MARGKYEDPNAGKPASAKPLALILAVVLLIGSVAGGTVAWLIDQTDAVVNTFTYGDINIKLEESDTGLDKDNDPTTNEYPMVPGNELTKDPTVTVLAGNEACWLLVKMEESENFDTFLEYTMADGWTQLQDAEGDPVVGVFYQEVDKDTDNQEVAYPVIKDNKVKVKDEVTKEQLNALDKDGAQDYPTLTLTAYAVQKDNIATALTAWQAIQNQNTTPEETAPETT